jgi:hypothetical protein
MSNAEADSRQRRPKLRWYQYSLRTLLAFVTLCALLCSWYAVKKQQAKREQEAAVVFGNLGAYLEWSEPSGPQWVRNCLGDELFTSVSEIVLAETEVRDADLAYLHGLPQLETLSLFNTKISDTGLENLKGVPQLRTLCLLGTKTSDAGLENLKGLSHLEYVDLVGTKVTDAGLEHLKGLKRLEIVIVGGTAVSDAGMEELEGAIQGCWVFR